MNKIISVPNTLSVLFNGFKQYPATPITFDHPQFPEFQILLPLLELNSLCESNNVTTDTLKSWLTEPTLRPNIEFYAIALDIIRDFRQCLAIIAPYTMTYSNDSTVKQFNRNPPRYPTFKQFNDMSALAPKINEFNETLGTMSKKQTNRLRHCKKTTQLNLVIDAIIELEKFKRLLTSLENETGTQSFKSTLTQIIDFTKKNLPTFATIETQAIAPLRDQLQNNLDGNCQLNSTNYLLQLKDYLKTLNELNIISCAPCLDEQRQYQEGFKHRLNSLTPLFDELFLKIRQQFFDDCNLLFNYADYFPLRLF